MYPMGQDLGTPEEAWGIAAVCLIDMPPHPRAQP